MASGQVKIAASNKIVEETKRLYRPILAKPLDEKQLIRPSFKFIQDLVKSLMIETKLLRDVFNANHFNSDKQQTDKKAKIDFIQKLIDFAANNRQAVASCLATKVVAGLEPNKTNELLQSLARIAQQKLSSHDERRPRTFTRQVSGGSRPTSTSAATTISSQAIGSATKSAAESSSSNQSSAPKANHQRAANLQVSSSVQLNPNASEQGKISSAQPVEQQQQQRRSSANFVAANAQDKQQKIVNQNVSPATTETDIARGTQFVLANLKSLKETIATLCKLEDSLRASLMLATRSSNVGS